MSQTSVSAGGQSIGVAGQVSDSGDHDIDTGFNQNSAQMPFGYGVAKGNGERAYALPSGVSGTIEIAGINVFSHNHVKAGAVDAAGNQSGDLGASGLLQNASMQLGVKGRFWVPVAFAVNKGDRPYCYVIATGTITQGAWVGSNMGASYVRDCRAQGRFVTGTFTSADGTVSVAVLEADFTNQPA